MTPTRGETRRLRETVSSYKRSAGRGPDMLFLTDVTAASDATVYGAVVDDDVEDGTETTDTTDERQPPTTEGESSLNRIAREHLADHEFRLEADEESLVGGARRRASEQDRAPAIDPRLQDERNDVGEDG